MNEEQSLLELINSGENDQLEFKEIVRNEDIAKVICSFLNGKGGRILVGVSDSGEIKGIENADFYRNKLNSFIFSVIIPEAPITISVESIAGKEILMLKVYGGSKQPYLFDGNIFYRLWNKTVKATSLQISELIHGRQISELHWERQIVLGAEIEDLDKKLINEIIIESRKNQRSNFTGNDVLDFLSYFGLYQNGLLTNACIILFAKNPSKFLPQIRVRLTEYAGGKTDDNLLRDEVLDDNLFVIQEKLERYISNLGIRSTFDKNQWKRIDFKFPPKALQEGVINALMHRDYVSTSGGVAISIYPDSFVIVNSGHLPDSLKVNELKKSHRSHPVNPDIAHIVFLKGLIDKLGRGTLKVLDECKKYGLLTPVWKDNNDGITLTFFGPKALATKKEFIENDGVSDGVNDVVTDGVVALINDGVSDGVIDGVNDGIKLEILKIVNIIYTKEGLKTLDIAIKCGKSKPSTERYIKIAKEVGIIEFKGSPKIGGYYITQKMRDKLINE